MPKFSFQCHLCLGLLLSLLPMTLAAANRDSPELSSRTEPLWELGVFSFIASVPDYPAAEESQERILTLPAFIYRGQILRSDRRRGARLQLLERKNLQIDISASAAFPLSSDKNQARENMPSRDWIGELGPRLVVPLQESPQGWLTELRLPLRGAASISEKQIAYQGLRFAPNLVSRKELASQQIEIFLRFTINFINQKYANLFYGVEPRYATEERYEYQGKPGYFGSQITAFLQKRIDRFRIFGGLEYQSFRGSSNSDSPLFRQEDQWVAVLGGLWMFYRSEQRAL